MTARFDTHLNLVPDLRVVSARFRAHAVGALAGVPFGPCAPAFRGMTGIGSDGSTLRWRCSTA